MSYYLAPSLRHFFDEVNAAFPNRDRASDGWIGDASHSARPSDHNPDYANGGVVRAIDVDNNSGNVREAVVRAAIGDPRVWYVISNRRIYSVTYGWAARYYSGSNPHDKHVHVSIRHTDYAEENTGAWLEDAAPAKPKRRVKLKPIDLSNTRDQFLIAADAKRGSVEWRNGVARIQRALNAEGCRAGAVDGYVGEQTLNAWYRWEDNLPKSWGRPRVPDRRSLDALAKGRFRFHR